jgi:colanic acid biosynthesis glycosyl transferase WcaI
MKVLVHDFAGHPFQVQLSRELARRGHTVDHAYFAGDIGPKGLMVRTEADPPELSITALGGSIDYSKANLLKRRFGDVAYGKELARHIGAFEPDVVICGNAPTEVVSPLPKAATSVGAAFVYWIQDLNGLAAKRIIAKKSRVLGAIVGGYYMWLDKCHIRAADQVVVISDAFLRNTDAMEVPRDRVTTIANWGAIDEIAPTEKQNPWATAAGLRSGTRYVYSGTLARKHNPQLLLSLAQQVPGDDDVVVVANGVGADWLASLRERPSSLRLMPLQSFAVFPEVLGAADVLLAVIEREAGSFSVPSKILSYLCAARPIVLAAPADNLAARMIREAGAGVVVEPEDIEGFVAAARHFAKNDDAAERAGAAGRAYAEANFAIERVADKFEAVFSRAIRSSDRSDRDASKSVSAVTSSSEA